ncbi:matrix metalloproteinase-16 isoform X2 [Patella vulgata]|uniref:matrix metalloproteinase-16 isoform X2 n=1 Tax=Patella vulgata TaxID=6465 RepID=UPI002180942B|nr:matrix metalloproteinase-16 isoform X2 [Patella vulgata]
MMMCMGLSTTIKMVLYLRLLLFIFLWKVAATSTTPSTVTNSDSLVYLMEFGYLAPQNPKTGALRSEESVSIALKRLQRMGGVKETGVLDNDTKQLMTLRRCGVPDNVGIGNGARRKRYAVQGSKWAKKELTYRTKSYPGALPRNRVETEVKRALEIWSKVTPLTFIKEERMDGDVDLEIKFVRRSHGDGNPFDGQGRTLAHAFFPQYGGDAHFDEEEPWTVDTPEGVNLFQVAAHEFGHSLGLAHSDDSRALMAPFYRGYQKSIELSSDDINAIRELYGSPSPYKPTRSPTITVPSICNDPTIDAITRTTDGLTYVFKGQKYYRLNGYGVDLGYPRDISWDWKGVEGPIDGVVHWDNGFTYFFKGEYYYKFHNFRFIYAKLISEGFRGIPNDVDAVFVWGGNGKTYFFKGDRYWRYTDRAVDFGYPKPLTVWRGLPNRIDGAFKWRNGRTYFFSGNQYYRFHDNKFKVDEGYPRNIGNWWLGCPDRKDNIIQSVPPGTDQFVAKEKGQREADSNQDDELLLVVTESKTDVNSFSDSTTITYSLQLILVAAIPLVIFNS